MLERIDKVLVALKPWQGNLPLSSYHARFLSQSLRAHLRLLSCVYEPELSLGVLKSEADALAAQAGLVEAERAVLTALGASLQDTGIVAESEVRWGRSAEDSILAEVERWRADLLVVGTHQGGLRPHTRLAQVDWQLMRSCPCPMLLARDPQFEGYTTVLAAVDPLHRHAEPEGLDRAILATASMLARASKSKLLVGHVYPNPESFGLASSVEVLPGGYYATESTELVHRQALLTLVAEFGVGESETALLSGDPAEQLGNYILQHGVDLIVLGALKRGARQDRLLGSTAEKLVAEVPCDVLLMKLAG